MTETLVAEKLRCVNWNKNLKYVVCNDEIIVMGITKEFTQHMMHLIFKSLFIMVKYK